MATEFHSPPGRQRRSHSTMSSPCKHSFLGSYQSFSNSYLLPIHFHQQGALGPCTRQWSQLCFHSWWGNVLALVTCSSRQIRSLISFPFPWGNNVHQLPLQGMVPLLWLLSYSNSYLESFITNCKMYLALIPEHGISYSHLPFFLFIHFQNPTGIIHSPWVHASHLTLPAKNVELKRARPGCQQL